MNSRHLNGAPPTGRRTGRSAFALPALVALLPLAWLAGCSTPMPADGQSTVVERSSNRTVWATPEAQAAAEAAAAAKAAAARPPAPRSTPAAPPAATVVPATPSTGPARATGVANVDIAAEATQRIVYFEFDQFEIKDEFKPMLERRARALLAAPGQRLTLEGHADERGGREYNVALGQKRAEAVRRAMLLLGVREEQVEAISFGQDKPAVDGHDDKAWSANRRVELKDR